MSENFRYLQQENTRLRVENGSMRAEIIRLRQAMKALHELMSSLNEISAKTDLYQLLQTVLRQSLEAVDSEDGTLMLLDEETGELVFVEVFGSYREQLLNYRLPAGEGVAGWVAQNRQPRLVADTRLEPIFSSLVDQMTGLRSVSLICLPLIDGQRTLGVLEAVNTRSGRAFDSQDLDVMGLAANLATLALVRAEQIAA